MQSLGDLLFYVKDDAVDGWGGEDEVLPVLAGRVHRTHRVGHEDVPRLQESGAVDAVVEGEEAVVELLRELPSDDSGAKDLPLASEDDPLAGL